MKVRKGQVCRFEANGWDRFDHRAYTPENGTLVRVCAPRGCPPPNTMGHCYVETLEGKFLGLVSTGSLTPAGRMIHEKAKAMQTAKEQFDREYLK